MGKLSSLDIKRQQFKKVMRGFDPEEVEAFHEIIAEQVEDLLTKNDALKQKVLQLETKLEGYQKNEKNLNEILSRTREMQEEASKNLKKREEIVLKDAEFRAVEILENARKEVRQIRDEIVGLQHRKDSFVSRLKYLIQSYMDLLKMMEIENLLDEQEEKRMENTIKTGSVFMKGTNDRAPKKAEPAKAENDPVVGSGDDPETIGHSDDDEIYIHDISDLIDRIDDQPEDKTDEKSKKKKTDKH